MTSPDTNRELTAPHVAFTFNPALEFLISMNVSANVDRRRVVMSDLNIPWDPAWLNRLEDFRHQLTPFILRELTFFFGTDDLSYPMGIELLPMEDAMSETQNLPEFIESVASLSDRHLLGSLIDAVVDETVRRTLREAMKTGMDALYSEVEHIQRGYLENGRIPAPLRRIFEATADVEEFRSRLHRLMEAFYTRAFSQAEDAVHEHGLRLRDRYEAMFMQNPAAFFKHHVKGDRSMFGSDVWIHISQMLHMGIITVHRSQTPDWVILGEKNELLQPLAVNKEIVERVLKAVADKNRMEIVRRLANRPWYGQELAQALGLTPAAVSYHMNFLFALDVVTTEKTDHRFYYSLDTHKLEELLDAAKETLLGRNEFQGE